VNNSPYYEPWVGSNYQFGGFGGLRLLIVGESSFERDFKSQPNHLSNDTAKLAAGEFKPKHSGFWRFIQRSITGNNNITTTSLDEFWNSVSLVNLVQRPMSSSKDRPTTNDFVTGCDSLKAYIGDLKPDCIIVYSKSSWSILKKELELEESCKNLVDESSIPLVLHDANVSYISKLFDWKPKVLLLRHPSSRPKLGGAALSPLVGEFINY
jgi:hypothetical protein